MERDHQLECLAGRLITETALTRAVMTAHKAIRVIFSRLKLAPHSAIMAFA